MKITSMKLSSRVMTPYGPGTVIGFEAFTVEGMQAPMTDEPTSPTCRIVVKLDRPENWAGPGYPHFWEKDLK